MESSVWGKSQRLIHCVDLQNTALTDCHICCTKVFVQFFLLGEDVVLKFYDYSISKIYSFYRVFQCGKGLSLLRLRTVLKDLLLLTIGKVGGSGENTQNNSIVLSVFTTATNFSSFRPAIRLRLLLNLAFISSSWQAAFSLLASSSSAFLRRVSFLRLSFCSSRLNWRMV